VRDPGRLRIFSPSGADLVTDHAGHGEGLIAFRMFAGLAERGHEVVVCARRFALREEPPFRTVDLGPGGPVESLQPLVYAALAARALRRLGGPTRFDVAHWLFPSGADYLLDASPVALPLVIGPLALDWPDESPRGRHPGRLVRLAAEPAFYGLHRRTMHRARELLVCIPEVASALRAAERARSRVVPFGIDTSRFMVRPMATRPTILFIGRLERRKGIYELFEAFEAVRREIPEACLRVVGAGEELDALRDRAAAIGRSVEVLGAVPNTEVGDLLAEAWLLCLPSYGEPFGMTVLEAMASGRAVVATDRGGPRHLVDPRGGIRVPPADAPALAGALVEILSDRGRLEAMGRFNRDRVEREFDWSRVLAAVEAAYADALHGRRE
jgi:glycosyltransferase involved in cell wall biosynthesis